MTLAGFVYLQMTQWPHKQPKPSIIDELGLIHFHDVKLYCAYAIDVSVQRKHLHAFFIATPISTLGIPLRASGHWWYESCRGLFT